MDSHDIKSLSKRKRRVGVGIDSSYQNQLAESAPAGAAPAMSTAQVFLDEYRGFITFADLLQLQKLSIQVERSLSGQSSVDARAAAEALSDRIGALISKWMGFVEAEQ
jgi:hypothetical protein